MRRPRKSPWRGRPPTPRARRLRGGRAHSRRPPGVAEPVGAGALRRRHVQDAGDRAARAEPAGGRRAGVQADGPRVCFLAGMSCHSQQRGSSVRLSRSMTGEMEDFAAAFATPAPAMRKMEKLSEKSRELHNQQPAPASSPLENGSTAVLRPRLEARLAAAARPLASAWLEDTAVFYHSGAKQLTCLANGI